MVSTHPESGMQRDDLRRTPAFASRGPKRIALVVFVVRSVNLEKYAEAATRLFGARFERMHGPTVPGADDQIDVFLDYDCGIELIAPLGADSANAADLTKFLDQHGEGIFALVYQVDDLDRSLASAKAEGYPVAESVLNTNADARRAYVASYTKRISDIQEVHVGPFIGLEVIFGDIRGVGES